MLPALTVFIVEALPCVGSALSLCERRETVINRSVCPLRPQYHGWVVHGYGARTPALSAHGQHGPLPRLAYASRPPLLFHLPQLPLDLCARQAHAHVRIRLAPVAPKSHHAPFAYFRGHIDPDRMELLPAPCAFGHVNFPHL